ncbi:MAG: SprT-like domain-containing protein [Trueperaceae bacterium]|nr:SprT-like domain-containing protein [Trueperaceae bacterium]
MNFTEAKTLAVQLLDDYQLKDWVFKFDHAKRRFGSCNYTLKQITLSKHLTELNSEEQVRETLLHEIAHALTPGDHHGKRWQAKCLELGIKPERCYKSQEVNQPTAKYFLYCSSCELKVPRLRRSNRVFVCKACCQKYNQGRLTEKFKLEWQTA